MVNIQIDRCPVCGMKTDHMFPVVQYQKMYFHFCSEQCRESFNAHPRLYTGRSLRDERIKVRVLHLAELVDDKVSMLLVSYLKEMMGVREVSIAGDRLNIRYDLLQVNAAQVERKLNEAGVRLSDGWLLRLRRTWLYNSEETELANLASSPSACCNRPPAGV